MIAKHFFVIHAKKCMAATKRLFAIYVEKCLATTKCFSAL